MSFGQLRNFSLLFGLVPALAVAQQGEGLLPTQVLVRADSKTDVAPTVSMINLQLNSKAAPLISLTPVQPGSVQIALLIDDGLSRSAGIQLNDLRGFATTLPAGAELMVGYMDNGRVDVVVPFTTDHAAAAEKIRIPLGISGVSASPYFCLSEFVKRWEQGSQEGSSSAHKARFVMMVTNGVDPYNGSDRITNQDSPYVAAAVVDAQRAGVVVSSIYYRDAGFRGGQGSFSGQSYLEQVAEGTGGRLYNMGPIDPVSLAPLLKEFVNDVSESYIATFRADAAAGGREHLVRLKMSSTVPKLKLRHADQVRPGNTEGAPANTAQLSPALP